jgi:hypothetical protein
MNTGNMWMEEQTNILGLVTVFRRETHSILGTGGSLRLNFLKLVSNIKFLLIHKYFQMWTVGPYLVWNMDM